MASGDATDAGNAGKVGWLVRVNDVLRSKGTSVATIAPDVSVAELLATLADRKVGALVVSSDGRTVEGIVSERDVVRKLNDHGADLLDYRVSSIMTADVRTCSPDDGVEVLARTMTDGRFRHMPVLVDGELAGIVSIGDIVKGRIDELEGEREQLVDYISGAH